ncbi:MAG: hypothetical protein DI626_01865 [Micavibrio aeruginosavorus]|uniref:DUF7790 domain-containing protein n=1 Tax=Micavibrio aeruginosavorus TaxID=349221 RepID=A0A2W5BZA4_9BACT|nr:MAG: hypothetical protein DI626_01865 [Micavibrio aeruginosavorus]
MQTAIRYGFAADIDKLNSKTAVSGMAASASGENSPYAGPIHLTVVGENISFHKRHLEKISTAKALQGGLYAGAAGFINLSYIAASKASGAVLFDINVYQTLFWNIVFEKIARNSDKAHFREDLSNIALDLREKGDLQPGSIRESFAAACKNAGTTLFKNLSEDTLPQWIEKDSRISPEGTWMHDSAAYAHIRSLVKGRAIGAVTLDITDRAACHHMGRYLDGDGAKIRLLYASNILNFLQPVIRKTDFIGRRISDRTQENAKANLYGWMERKGHIIECDNLERNTPLLVPAHIYKPQRPPVPAFS